MKDEPAVEAFVTGVKHAKAALKRLEKLPARFRADAGRCVSPSAAAAYQVAAEAIETALRPRRKQQKRRSR